MLKENNLVMIFFSKDILLASTFKRDISINFIKNIISNNNVGEESTSKIIIESIKKTSKGIDR